MSQPCQSLFVAPSSHVWHYKYIRPILNVPTWPNFLCPNCRAVADLEADVDDVVDFEMWDDNGVAQEDGEPSEARHVTSKTSAEGLADHPTQSTPPSDVNLALPDVEAAFSVMNIPNSLNSINAQPAPAPSTPQRTAASKPPSSVTLPVASNVTAANDAAVFSPMFHNGASGLTPGREGGDCPMTPRIDAGPFVLDGSGSAGRAARPRLREELLAGSTTDPK